MPKALFVSSNGLVSTGTRPHAHRLQVVQISFLLVGFSLAQKSCGFGAEEFTAKLVSHFHLYWKNCFRSNCNWKANAPFTVPVPINITVDHHIGVGASAREYSIPCWWPGATITRRERGIESWIESEVSGHDFKARTNLVRQAQGKSV